MDHFVRVIPSASGRWTVDGGRSAEPLSFQKRPAAVAFGRALAYSTKRDLLVVNRDGALVRQPRETLTYPAMLD